ncbi:GDP-L-fucose synthase [Haematospirillum sp. H1815]|uniref:GDP-L-fucose synthase n=1 Tax=Haematospirillum sp. H1815 TaxID=2723108 RepID=UPI00143BCB60|nr:GDP-L-fucose synthase [Haematospirillum sp. H1815]NKD76847.1 GDP-L-fucose synthase [Haematospirillum sp. H1815]
MDEKIYVAGHRGMVGSAIIRALRTRGVESSQILTRTHDELDLINQGEVEAFFARERPTQVYLAAAKVGGIHANNIFPAEFIYENLMVQANVIHAAHRNNVQKLLFLGSSCIYPRLVPQPMAESALLTGSLEPTNEPYAIAKIAGIKLCESYNRQYGRDYRSVMPTNLYGPGDNYHHENSHVVPALIRRFHEAKVADAPQVVIWGSGKPRREFLYVDDMANASVFVMNLEAAEYNAQVEPQMSLINVGFGSDVTIAELAQMVSGVIGYQGEIVFDRDKPDGPPRKLMDSARLLAMGWRPTVGLEDGIRLAYQDMQQHMCRK